jgi:restriction system protein
MVDTHAAVLANNVPTFDKLMAPALRTLKAMGGSATNEELLNKIIELEQISPEVQVVQHVDHRQTKLNYNLAWAKTYLKKVGAIDNTSGRGVWSLTKEGEALTPADIASIPARVRRQDAQARRARELEEPQDEDPTVDQDGMPRAIFWKDQLIEVLRAMQADAFERLAQRLLREAGFIKVEVHRAQRRWRYRRRRSTSRQPAFLPGAVPMQEVPGQRRSISYP